MKNLLTLITALTIGISLVFSQSDPKADKVIQSSQKHFKSLGSVNAKFTYTLTNPSLEKPISKTGELLISGNKYKIDFSEEVMYCDGKTVWAFMPEDEEVTIDNYDPTDGLSIDRIYKYYEENPKNRYDGEVNGNHKVTIFIADEKADIWKVELFVSKDTKILDSAVIFSRNGSKTYYKLDNIKTNVPVKDSDFEFSTTDYPDVYINDMRE